MAIGTGWADGAWIDAGWVTGAWSDAEAVVTTVAPSGGWKFVGYYDAFKERKTKREREQQQLEDHFKTLDKTDAEIAELLHRDEIQAKQDRELADLEQLVATSFSNKELKLAKEFSEKAARAYLRAVQQGNFSAFEGLQREMDRAMEEDEFLFLALAILE